MSKSRLVQFVAMIGEWGKQVKARLTQEVKRRGGNALMRFEYGQRSHPVWKQLLTLQGDTDSWHGRGLAAKL